MNAKIRDLLAQIEREKQKIDRCPHQFGPAFSNPETVREPYGYKTVVQGSDTWSEPAGYRDVQKPRWTRTCQTCGLEQHTDKHKPILVGNEPDFDTQKTRS